jgi:hypothetical protein
MDKTRGRFIDTLPRLRVEGRWIRTLRLIQAVSGSSNARQAIVIVWPSTKEVIEVVRWGALASPGSL